MKVYIIRGTQIDGCHEYRIYSFVETEEEMTMEKAEKILLENHAFGYDPDDEDNDPNDEYFNYGDGLTAIKFRGLEQITDEDYAVLKKLRLAF